MVVLGSGSWVSVSLAALAALSFAACGGDSRGTAEQRGVTGGTSGSAGASGGQGALGGGSGRAGGGGKAGGEAGAAAGGGGRASGGRGGGGGAGAIGGEGGEAASGGNGGSTGGGAGTGGAGMAGAGATSGAGGAESDLEAIDETVRAFCEAAATCCAEQNVVTMLDGCESLYRTYQPAVPSIMSGAIVVDRDALARCQAAYAPGPDQCNMNAVVEACRGVFVGQRQVDEPCIGGYDCDRSEGAMTCLITDTSSEEPVGVCKEVPHAALDEPCVTTCRTDSDCSSTTYGVGDTLALCFESDGLYCQYVGPGSVCRPLVALGEPCSSFDECGSRAICDTTCLPLSERGEPCGYACVSKYQCGSEGECVDPNWATEYACSGHAPGP